MSPVRTIPFCLLLAAGALLAGCAGGPAPLSDPAGAVAFDRSAPPDTVGDISGFQTRIHREGRLHIGGQPSGDALRGLAARGFTAVVNLRTPGEMDDRERVPFDEAALVAELGLEYVHIPLGGADHPYTPAAVATFAAALERHPGQVLLHCTVGWRASHLWAAYLVKYGGLPVEEAYVRAEAIGIGRTPLARLLDVELRMTETE